MTYGVRYMAHLVFMYLGMGIGLVYYAWYLHVCSIFII